MEKMERNERIEDAKEACNQAEGCTICPEHYKSDICNEARMFAMETSPSLSPSPSASYYSENELEMFNTISKLRKNDFILKFWLMVMALMCYALAISLIIG